MCHHCPFPRLPPNCPTVLITTGYSATPLLRLSLPQPRFASRFGTAAALAYDPHSLMYPHIAVASAGGKVFVYALRPTGSGVKANDASEFTVGFDIRDISIMLGMP